MANDPNSVPTYGRCFAGLAVGLAPFCLTMGIAALFGANTVTWNGQYVYGMGAIFAALALNLFFPAVFAGVQKFGFWLLGLLKRKESNRSV